MNANQQQRAMQAARSGATTIPALYLDFLPPHLMNAPRRYFGYGMRFASIAAAGGSLDDSFTVQGDSDFLCTSIMGAINDPAAPETPDDGSGLTIRIESSGSGRNWDNEALAFDALVGTAQLPGFLPYPAFIDKSSQVTATLVNNKTADDVEVRLTFAGFKIFSRRSAGL